MSKKHTEMSNKSMKGLLKGLRYISQIFDDENGEEDEVEIQIGLPTDVKHVAHIGSDGPSNHDGPSWLNEFKPETGGESTAIVPAASRKEPKIKSTSEDSRGKKAENCQGRDLPEVPKSSRRHSLSNKSGDGSLKKKESKNKHSKRSSKEYSEDEVKASRKSQELNTTSSSHSRSLPDIPKKTRGRRKSKEMVGDSESSKSRSKGDSNGLCTSENGHDSDTMLQKSNSPHLSPPNFEGGGKEYR